jgi:hypothetical protein
MVNTALLWSVGTPSTSEIFTRQFEDGVFGIVHEYDPLVAGILATTSSQLDPLSIEYSIRTLPLV